MFCRSPALRNQVDRFGCSANKDDLAHGAGIEEAPRLFARGLVSIRSARRKLMGCAMDIGVLVLVEVGDTIDDRLRLLRSCAVVEPDERMSVDGFAQNGEVAANCFHVKRVGREAEFAQERGLVWIRRHDRWDNYSDIGGIERAGLATGFRRGWSAEVEWMRDCAGELRCSRSEGCGEWIAGACSVLFWVCWVCGLLGRDSGRRGTGNCRRRRK